VSYADRSQPIHTELNDVFIAFDTNLAEVTSSVRNSAAVVMHRDWCDDGTCACKETTDGNR